MNTDKNTISKKFGGTSVINKLRQQREFMILLIVIGLCVVLSFASPYFLSSANILAVLLGLSVETIVAVGMILIIISGGFDLSVGSTVAFTGALTAYCMRAGVPIVVAIIIGLFAGILIGLVNGLLIAKLRINAFIITLGMMSVVRGLAMVTTNGLNISPLPVNFSILGQGKIFGVQSLIIVAIILVIVGDVLLRKSRYFRQIYYIGSSEKAAKLSGINVVKTQIVNFVICSGLAALAGILLTARLGSATATAGTGLEFRVITAVILGGGSLSGGEGTVLGAFLGSLIMALISNGLNLLGVDVYWQTLVLGSTLIVAVMIDNFSKSKK